MPRSFLVRRNSLNAVECEQWNEAVKLAGQHPWPAAHQVLGRRLLAHLDDICSFHQYPGSVQQDCNKQRDTAGCRPLPVLDHCSCFKAYCSSLIAFTTSYRKVAEQRTVNREGPQTECAAVSLIDSQLLDSTKQFEDKTPSGTLPLECSVAEPKLNGPLSAKKNGAETRGRQIAGQTMKVKPNFQCEQCGKVFKTKYTLNIHCKMPSHTTSKPFVCPTCGKGFRLSSTLCRHKIIHTSQRPHCCHICNKSFNRSSTLKTHLRTHSNQKEFICEQCGKGFHQKGNLRNHALIHTGEKPYSCSVCNKSFNKLSNLKFHMHSHTDQKPYRCRFCKTPFCRRGELKMHITRYHRRQQREDKTSNSQNSQI